MKKEVLLKKTAKAFARRLSWPLGFLYLHFAYLRARQAMIMFAPHELSPIEAHLLARTLLEYCRYSRVRFCSPYTSQKLLRRVLAFVEQALARPVIPADIKALLLKDKEELKHSLPKEKR